MSVIAEETVTSNAPEFTPPLEQEAAAPVFAGADDDSVIDGTSRFVRDATIENYDRDPRITRWGYNPARRGVIVMNRRSGLSDPLVPVGRFFAIKSFPSPEENFTLDENKPHEIMGTVFAQEAENVVRETVGGVGYQSVLFGEEDSALVAVINDTLIPTLGEIRELFKDESPIDAVCAGADELDFGQPRDHCATCHLKWIKSPACQAYMEEVALKGMHKRVRDNGVIKDILFKPSTQQLESTRQAVQAGLEAYLKVASKVWGKTVSELDNKTRTELVVDEHYMRKDLHAHKPADAAIASAEAFAEKIVSHQQAPQPTDSVLLDYIERAEARQADRDAESRQFMSAIVDRLAPKAAEAPAAPAAPETKQGD